VRAKTRAISLRQHGFLVYIDIV